MFDGLTFKNDEADIIDVKKTLAKNTRSAIDLLSHEANLRNTNDPVFNKLAGRKKSKPRKTLLPRFDPFPYADRPPTSKKKESEIKVDEGKDVESEDETTKASTVNDILSDASKKGSIIQPEAEGKKQ